MGGPPFPLLTDGNGPASPQLQGASLPTIIVGHPPHNDQGLCYTIFWYFMTNLFVFYNIGCNMIQNTTEIQYENLRHPLRLHNNMSLNQPSNNSCGPPSQ